MCGELHQAEATLIDMSPVGLLVVGYKVTTCVPSPTAADRSRENNRKLELPADACGWNAGWLAGRKVDY